MKAITVLYGGALTPHAFKPVNGEETALVMAVEKAGKFPGTEKIVFLGLKGNDYPGLLPASEKFSVVLRSSWTEKSLLEELVRLAAGYDLTYFAWADCPLLDVGVTTALSERHLRYAAEYSYADGWPYGFTPELLAPQTAAFLQKISGDDDSPVGRDMLFSVLQKDINAFDIETEIAPVDLRCYRLSFCADSKRNFLLIERFLKHGLTCADDAEKIISAYPLLLRTLPSFFNIQVYGGCPQECTLCPWPVYGKTEDRSITERRDFMPLDKFETLLDNIVSFSGDAVISLSLWGEISLHSEKLKLINSVLSRPELSLVIETSGIGWKDDEIKTIKDFVSSALPRKNSLLPVPLSWIISLDAHNASRYRDVRGPGFAEAVDLAKKLLEAFPGDAYVQAVRVKDFEDDIEQFYRYWRDIEIPSISPNKSASHVIIQKYNDFCGALPRLQASDISPVIRRPCWHNMKDITILLDGSVPCCKDDLSALQNSSKFLGNVFTASLEEIWKNGETLYLEHAAGNYPGLCAKCDEFYTYNF